MILKALALQEMHSLGTSRRIEPIRKGTFKVGPGSLFPEPHKTEEAGWSASSWGESGIHRKAQYDRLAKADRKQLEIGIERRGRISLAIARQLEAT